MSSIFSRVERFARVASTNDVVRGWLADGLGEVAIASADEQTAGRGRAGRTWTAPAGTSLLLSVGFRPTYLEPERTWLLGAVVAVAMAEAAEGVAALPPLTVRLKWPNDLVLETADGYRKVGGVLGESTGLGTDEVRAIVGIGVNVGWLPEDVPIELASTMTTLGAVARAPLTVERLGEAFLDRLPDAMTRLRDDAFAMSTWTDRQVTTGREVILELPGGSRREAHAEGVDPRSGALLISPPSVDGPAIPIHAAEIVHVRLARHGL
ncbi:MAG TPA: biotin--[acetyl-CoA-carboxylase] ligase [Candidatus Limnocylindrales bacterium]|nr:biotin--[acetyl-CoA-carboxylase] ligase [Candidatus Limnocylindrales bacterium]